MNKTGIHKLYNWKKGMVSWKIGKTLYLSVVFTWQLPAAKKLAKSWKGKVIAGGPAVSVMPDYLRDVAACYTETVFPVLAHHNPMATFTTRGCPNNCSFCAVPKSEGEFRELEQWVVAPVVCDNNLLASSRQHFDSVIDRLKAMPYVDFNQGLDARHLTSHHLDRLSELRVTTLRFAFDHIDKETIIMNALSQAKRKGFRDLRVYVLIGHEDTPEDAIYRLEIVRGAGALTNPMRYQPLYSVKKNEYVGDRWTENELKNVMRYYSRLIFLGHIPFDEYCDSMNSRRKQ
ncbi:MAG: hypothetical protein H7843_16290 [Nitrospirota bacterium]